MNSPLHILDAGLMPYQPARDLQLQLHEKVLAATDPTYSGGVLMLVEHPSVITIGRRTNAAQNLLAPPALLKLRSIDVVETDRGGDITFHGPGQLVAYPILSLNTYNLNLHAYMRLLEQAVIDTLARFHIPAARDPAPKPATGVWVQDPANPDALAKICALGVKLRRWVTLHGLALNLTTNLNDFSLINPCGLSRPVTSMQKILGDKTPSMPELKSQLIAAFQHLLSQQKEAGGLNPSASSQL